MDFGYHYNNKAIELVAEGVPATTILAMEAEVERNDLACARRGAVCYWTAISPVADHRSDASRRNWKPADALAVTVRGEWTDRKVCSIFLTRREQCNERRTLAQSPESHFRVSMVKRLYLEDK